MARNTTTQRYTKKEFEYLNAFKGDTFSAKYHNAMKFFMENDASQRDEIKQKEKTLKELRRKHSDLESRAYVLDRICRSIKHINNEMKSNKKVLGLEED